MICLFGYTITIRKHYFKPVDLECNAHYNVLIYLILVMLISIVIIETQ